MCCWLHVVFEFDLLGSLLSVQAYRKYHGLRARVRNAQKRSFDENVDFFGRKVEKIF
jgi:hypothetical protein